MRNAVALPYPEPPCMGAMANFRRALRRARLILDARRDERQRRINESATRVARLESDLEHYETARPFLVAETYAQLVSEIERHHLVVDGANRGFEFAIEDFDAAIMRAAGELVAL